MINIENQFFNFYVIKNNLKIYYYYNNVLL